MSKTRYVYRHSKRILVETYTPPGPKHRRKHKPFKVNWFKFPAWWIEVLHNAGAGARLLALIVLAEAFTREYLPGGSRHLRHRRRQHDIALDREC